MTETATVETLTAVYLVVVSWWVDSIRTNGPRSKP